MTVLADLLEITGTCIGDLVKEIREILEGHGHPAVAPVGFGTARDLLAFLDQGSDLPDRRWCIGEQSFQLFRNRRRPATGRCGTLARRRCVERPGRHRHEFVTLARHHAPMLGKVEGPAGPASHRRPSSVLRRTRAASTSRRLVVVATGAAVAVAAVAHAHSVRDTATRWRAIPAAGLIDPSGYGIEVGQRRVPPHRLTQRPVVRMVRVGAAPFVTEVSVRADLVGVGRLGAWSGVRVPSGAQYHQYGDLPERQGGAPCSGLLWIMGVTSVRTPRRTRALGRAFWPAPSGRTSGGRSGRTWGRALRIARRCPWLETGDRRGGQRRSE